MKDRIVEYPNRYKLIAVAGQDGVYDLEAVPGTITETGTPINKASLLAEGVDKNFCLDSEGTVSEALKRTPMWSSYLAFVGNVNTDQLDAAFGRNNEDRISGVGQALAMYARFKNPSIDIETDFPALSACNSLSDIFGFIYETFLENSFLSSSDSTHTGNHILTITNEMINGTTVIHLTVSTKGVANSIYATKIIFTLNGVEVYSAIARYSSTFEGSTDIDLAAANITTPGDYEFVVTMGSNIEGSNEYDNTQVDYELARKTENPNEANVNALSELIMNENIISLINSSPYAKQQFEQIPDSVLNHTYALVIQETSGLPIVYNTLEQLFSDSSCLTAIYNNNEAINIMANDYVVEKAALSTAYSSASLSCQDGRTETSDVLSAKAIVLKIDYITRTINDYLNIKTPSAIGYGDTNKLVTITETQCQLKDSSTNKNHTMRFVQKMSNLTLSMKGNNSSNDTTFTVYYLNCD